MYENDEKRFGGIGFIDHISINALCGWEYREIQFRYSGD